MSRRRIWQSLRRCLGVTFTCELDSSGDAVLLWSNAWLEVGYMFCIGFWLFGSHVFGVWVLHAEYRKLDCSCSYSCAKLGSTVDTCSATVRLGRIYTHFYVSVDSNPEVFFFVLRLNGEVAQSMPQVA